MQSRGCWGQGDNSNGLLVMSKITVKSDIAVGHHSISELLISPGSIGEAGGCTDVMSFGRGSWIWANQATFRTRQQLPAQERWPLSRSPMRRQ